MALLERQTPIDTLQSYTLHISSADRDRTRWPNAHDYEIELPSQHRNIEFMTMTTAEFCNEQYVIDATNDSILVDASTIATPDIVQVPQGTYTPTSLATVLETLIDATPSVTGPTTITYDTNTRKYTVSNASGTGVNFLVAQSQDSTDPLFEITIANRLLWKRIGFISTTRPVTEYQGLPASASTIVSDGVVNMKKDAFLMLEITNRTGPIVGRMDSTGPHSSPFAKIIFDPTATTTNATGVYAFSVQSVLFDSITRVRRLHFQLRRPNGEFADHQGVDHSFTLQFFTKGRKRRRQDYEV